nr:hypothetical protein CFP56_70263 [Quercus suber]
MDVRGYHHLTLHLDLQKPSSFCKGELYLLNCNKLADNQDFIDIFLAVIRKYHQGLSRHGRFDNQAYNWRYDMVITGSVIPKWFIHQSIGVEVTIKEPFSHLCDDWMGIAICVVFDSLPESLPKTISCQVIANGKVMSSTICYHYSRVGLYSDHIWLCYLLPQYFNKEDIKLLNQCEANELSQIDIKIETPGSIGEKKCGFRMLYKKDIEELNRTMAQSSNTDITPYEDLGVLHHNFNNSALVVEGLKGSMMTLIVRNTSNVVRRSMISKNLDGIGHWVQKLIIRLEKANNCVDKLFLPDEASAILGILLSCRCPPDKIAWAYSPSGMFTTSSAYKLLVSGDAVSQAGSSNVDTQKTFLEGSLEATGS